MSAVVKPPRQALAASGKKIAASVPRLADALRAPDDCGLRVGYDKFSGHIMLGSPGDHPPLWRRITDEDYTRLRERLERHAGFATIAKETMRDVVHMVAQEFAFDSAQQWLNGLKWDGTPRVSLLLHRYFGAPDTPYTRAVSRYAMTALAGRVMVPGIKADMVPVAVGPQGVRKSSAIAALVPAPEFFGELDLSRRDDDTARVLQGKLVVELPELKGLRARDVDSTKAFISACFDEWVEKYKVHAEKRPRRCILFGSTNEPQFLTDATGARRWLPFEADACDPDALAADRDQLWAEAVFVFIDRGGAIEFEDAERLARREHTRFEASDPWEAIIAEYTDAVPDLPALGDHSGPAEPHGPAGARGPKTWITAKEVMEHGLHLTSSQMGKATEQRIGSILRKLGWEPKQRRMNGSKPINGWIRKL